MSEAMDVEKDGRQRLLFDVSRPMEMELDEYKDLLSQLNEPDLDLASELVDAARYNDLDIARAIFHTHSTILSSNDCIVQDEHDNTPLHMAAANGHADMVALLLYYYGGNHDVINHVNKSGNTALHWASSNAHAQVVKLLLQVQDIDVLQRNAFGRSALTEGFTSDNTEVVHALLSHESASEERLVQTSNGDAMDEEKENENSGTVVHELVFGPSSSSSSSSRQVELQIQEQAMAKSDSDKILGQTNPDDDTTGLGVWAASLVMAQWLSYYASTGNSNYAPLVVVELGAGCGIPGLAAAKIWPTAQVFLTDFNQSSIQNAQSNIDRNECTSQARATHVNWQDPSTWPSRNEHQLAVDCLLGSDLIYESCMARLLHSTIVGMLSKPDGRFFYVSPVTGRQGQDEFWQLMGKDFIIEQHSLAKEYIANPLKSKDDDLCFMYFNELQSTDFRLYECRWK